MTREQLGEMSKRIVELATAAGVRLATAESCTGGLVAAFVTDVAGSSAVLDRGFVTYSNEAKADLLGVSAALLGAHGAVSEQVARAMAEGALRKGRADISVAVTGIAGPGGGSAAKPVGLVHFACAGERGTRHREEQFGEIGREQVRLSSVAVALEMIEEMLRGCGETAAPDQIDGSAP